MKHIVVWVVAVVALVAFGCWWFAAEPQWPARADETAGPAAESATTRASGDAVADRAQPGDVEPPRVPHPIAAAESPGSALVVRVVETGSRLPVRGITIQAVRGARPARGSWLVLGSTDADGTLVVEELAPGLHEVRAADQTGSARIWLSAGRRTELALEVPPAIEWRGRVLDSESHPVGDVPLWLSPLDEGSGPQQVAVSAADGAGTPLRRTGVAVEPDADGRQVVECSLEPGPYRLAVTAGFTRAGDLDFEVAPSSDGGADGAAREFRVPLRRITADQAMQRMR